MGATVFYDIQDALRHLEWRQARRRLSEIAEKYDLGRKRSAIIKWIHTRGLPAIKLPSGQYLIQKNKFAAWLEEKGVQLPLNSGN
jgi:Helix-turn-helix domain